MMTLSITADLLSIAVAGIATFTWMVKRIKSIRKMILEGNQISEHEKQLVKHLLSKATSAERRADIHAYIQIRIVEIDGRRTRMKIDWYFLGFFVIANTLFSIDILKQLFSNSNWILFTLLAALNIFLIASTFMAFIHGQNLRTIEDGWIMGAREALSMKVDKHASG